MPVKVEIFHPAAHGPPYALSAAMSAIVYKIGNRSIPANHSEQPHFGLADGVLVSLGILFVGALVCLLLLLA